MPSNIYTNMTELIRDYYDMPVTNYLNEIVFINGVSLSCDIYRVEPETVLTSNIFTGCTAVDANTQIIIGKDMSVASGTTLIPPYRCKGIIIGNVGTFTNEGTISMTARGASGEGKNIQLTTNYMISAVGGAGGGGVINSDSYSVSISGKPGSAPASGVLSCGGGGSGSRTGRNLNLLSGAGGRGTSFSGGAGGGGMSTYYDGSYTSPNGSNTGGTGGNGTLSGYSDSVDVAVATGGAGNPAGTNRLHRCSNSIIDTHNHNGAGGLIVILSDTIKSFGSLTSIGSQADGLTYSNNTNNTDYRAVGGSSGGGCIVLISRVANIAGTHSVSGGTRASDGRPTPYYGGAGGAGVYASYIVEDPILLEDLPVEIAISDTEHIDNIEPSENMRFIGMMDDDELYYEIMGVRHKAGSGYTLEDEEGTALTKRKALAINSPLTVEDDSTNEKTIIGADTSGALDLSKIIPPGTEHNATDGSPVGTIISFFGYTAPSGYLACDGTEYTKADYPYLATHLADLDTHYSTTTYAGSDADHFKVPDLRGEFLRGTGTNSHTNQGSGGDVGEHQNATEIPHYAVSGSDFYAYTKGTGAVDLRNPDTSIDNIYGTANGPVTLGKTAWSNNASRLITSRPTNTSVLYCIKCN